MGQDLAHTTLRAIAHLATYDKAEDNANDTARNKSTKQGRATNLLIGLPKEPRKPQNQHRNGEPQPAVVHLFQSQHLFTDRHHIAIEQFVGVQTALTPPRCHDTHDQQQSRCNAEPE